MDALNALIAAGDHAPSDNITTVPSLNIIPPRSICADILYNAFLDRRLKSPGDPVRLGRLLRDVARPVLMYDWDNTNFILA